MSYRQSACRPRAFVSCPGTQIGPFEIKSFDSRFGKEEILVVGMKADITPSADSDDLQSRQARQTDLGRKPD
jgi:hypothetical protein